MNWNFDDHVNRENVQETEARVLAERVRAEAERNGQPLASARHTQRGRIIALLLVCAVPVVGLALLYAAN